MPMNGLVPDEGQKFQAAMQGLMAMFQQMAKSGAPASTPRPSAMSAMGAFGPARTSALDRYRQQMIQDTQFSEMQRKQEAAKAEAARLDAARAVPPTAGQMGPTPMNAALKTLNTLDPLAAHKTAVEMEYKQSMATAKTAQEQAAATLKFQRDMAKTSLLEGGRNTRFGIGETGKNTRADIQTNLQKYLQDQRINAADQRQNKGFANQGILQAERLGAPDKSVVQVYDPDSPTGTSYVKRPDAVGKPGKPTSGLDITLPDGTKITQGRSTSGLQKPTIAFLEKKIIETGGTLEKLKNVQARFKPKYQELGTRWDNLYNSYKAKIKGGGSLSPEEKKEMRGFADHRSASIRSINQYIHDITGAQLSKAEEKRIRLGMADPGTGLLDGDDPITYEANMKGVIKDLERAHHRFKYYLAKGITDKEAIARRAPLESLEIRVNPKTGDRIMNIEGQWVPI